MNMDARASRLHVPSCRSHLHVHRQKNKNKTCREGTGGRNVSSHWYLATWRQQACGQSQRYEQAFVDVHAGAYAKAGEIKRIAKLFLKRDFDNLETVTSDEALVYVQAPTDFPYSGKYTGKTCVRDFMQQFNQSFRIVAVPEVLYYLNESGSVFVACDCDLEAVADPTVTVRTSVAFKVTLDENRQLAKVAVISDTLSAMDALQRAFSKVAA